MSPMAVSVAWMVSSWQSDMKRTVRISLDVDTYDRFVALYVALHPDMSFSDFLAFVLDSVEIKNAPSNYECRA